MTIEDDEHEERKTYNQAACSYLKKRAHSSPNFRRIYYRTPKPRSTTSARAPFLFPLTINLFFPLSQLTCKLGKCVSILLVRRDLVISLFRLLCVAFNLLLH